MALLRSSVVALSTIAALLAVGCRAKTSNNSPSEEGSLGTSEDALSSDNDKSEEAEDNTEDGVENGLGGAASQNDESPPDATDITALDAKFKVVFGAGAYFKPAGCLVSTRVSPGVWTHVFTNCTGPLGRVTYNGTVTSTWTISNGTLEVKHAAQNLTVKGRNVTVTLSGSRDVTYTRSGTVISKHRVGDWTGTLASNNDPSKSEPWTHHADFTSTWDPSTRCYTRDGEADNSLGNRTFGRKVSGFKVCGGLFACPSSGEFEIDRKDGSVKITVTFLGGTKVEITGPKGNTVTRNILCDAS
jgi:hypothetical protein